MKQTMYLTIFLLCIFTVSAAYFPQPNLLFEYKGASCVDGTIEINLTHQGRSIKFTDVNISVKSELYNRDMIPGKWSGDVPIESNYTGADYIGYKRFKYTSEQVFTQGKYVITITWPSNSIYDNSQQFGIECPGKPCKSNFACTSDQACINETCQWLNCGNEAYASGHTCLPKCFDNNECTNDNYIDGQCIYTKKEKCCNEKTLCDDGYECNNNICEHVLEKYNIFQRFWNWLISKYQ